MIKNPMLLKLLQMGCKVEFPNEYSLRGDTRYGYISVFHPVYGKLGLWNMSADGLKNALNDIERMIKENKG